MMNIKLLQSHTHAHYKMTVTTHPSHPGGHGFFGRWTSAAMFRRPSASDTAADYSTNHYSQSLFTSH